MCQIVYLHIRVQGIPLTAPDIEPSFTVLVWRVLLDVSFAIIVTILALNIVVAILVDRFSAIREEKVQYIHTFFLVPVFQLQQLWDCCFYHHRKRFLMINRGSVSSVPLTMIPLRGKER